MKFQVYFVLGTSLSCFPGLVLGQCVTVQDCAALGYTASSCDGGKGVKCPFGSGWFCAEDESTVCAENGFKYSCTGTGYAGGAGSACGGKYTQCSCASGYEWKNGRCQKKEVLNGADGDVYKCNGKVVGVKTSRMNFYVAMKDLGEMNWRSASTRCQDYSFCGTAKGSVPTLDQLKKINANLSELNSLLVKYGGAKMTVAAYWSSTGGMYVNYHMYVYTGTANEGFSQFDDWYVRPVLVSW